MFCLFTPFKCFISTALTVHPSLPPLPFLIAYSPCFLIAISSSLFSASNLEVYANWFPYSILCSQAVNYYRNVKLFPLGTTNTTVVIGRGSVFSVKNLNFILKIKFQLLRNNY
jgi:hypothetical protein